ncbi:hypothetical protein HY041_01755 [Candidatus Roizmanbacteria bacterium]|nr:hypothetical protein [Candidatus Roizmanbacteria bacterium]
MAFDELESRIKHLAEKYGWLAAPAVGFLHLRNLLDPQAKLRLLYGEVFSGYADLQNVIPALPHDESNKQSIQLTGKVHQLENNALAGLFYHAGKKSIHIVYVYPDDPGANQTLLKGDLETIGKTLDIVDYRTHKFPFTSPRTVNSMVAISIEETQGNKLQYTTLAYGNPKTFPRNTPVIHSEYVPMIKDGLVIKDFPMMDVFHVPLHLNGLRSSQVQLKLQDFERAKKLLRFVKSIVMSSPKAI